MTLFIIRFQNEKGQSEEWSYQGKTTKDAIRYVKDARPTVEITEVWKQTYNHY